MALTIVSFASILLCSLLFGVYWGPWLALSRSMASFDAPVFRAIVARMDANLGAIMGVLMPLALASIVPVIVLSFAAPTPGTAATIRTAAAAGATMPAAVAGWLAVAALACFVLTAVVTMAVEVPIVTRMRSWDSAALPDGWQQQRDRWVSYHRLRVGGGFVGLALLLACALF